MDLPPFLLDHWLSKHDFADPPIAFNLASSTGPRWSMAQLAALGDQPLDLGSTLLAYAPPQGSRPLREAAAEFHGAETDWVAMTTGASEALSILLCLQARPGGNVVIPDPAYPAYAAMAQAWGLKVRPYRLDRAGDFRQPAESLLAAVDDDTVAVIVNTPHNPTGSVMHGVEIRQVAQDLSQRRVPVIVDEVYHPLYFGPAQPSAAGIENVIVISDMSKALSLPGLRTGWLIDRDAVRRQRIVDARSYFTISGSPLIERLATHALHHRKTVIDRLGIVAKANLAALDALIAGSGGCLAWSRPYGGTTCFPWFADGRDSRPFCEALAEAGVLVAPGDCFGHPAHMRIGFAQQEDGFGTAIETMARQIAAIR